MAKVQLSWKLAGGCWRLSLAAPDNGKRLRHVASSTGREPRHKKQRVKSSKRHFWLARSFNFIAARNPRPADLGNSCFDRTCSPGFKDRKLTLSTGTVMTGVPNCSGREDGYKTVCQAKNVCSNQRIKSWHTSCMQVRKICWRVSRADLYDLRSVVVLPVACRIRTKANLLARPAPPGADSKAKLLARSIASERSDWMRLAAACCCKLACANVAQCDAGAEDAANFNAVADAIVLLHAERCTAC